MEEIQTKIIDWINGEIYLAYYYFIDDNNRFCGFDVTEVSYNGHDVSDIIDLDELFDVFISSFDEWTEKESGYYCKGPVYFKNQIFNRKPNFLHK